MKLVSIALLLLIGCGQSEQEKLQAALNEVERLKALKEKTAELVVQQRANMLSEAEKYDSYVWVKAGEKEKLFTEIEAKEKELEYWQNWHTKEEKRILRAMENRNLVPWKRGLEKKEHSLRSAHASLGKIKNIPGRTFVYEKEMLRLENLIIEIERDIEQYKKSKPAPPALPTHTKPKRRAEEIHKSEEGLRAAKEKLKSFLKEYEANCTSYETTIQDMRDDLKIIEVALDSIGTMHTNAVLRLSKFTNQD